MNANEQAKHAAIDAARSGAEHSIPGWVGWAAAFMHAKLLRFGEATTEDVRRIWTDVGNPEPPEPRAWGAVSRTLVNAGTIELAGFEKSKNKQAHCRPVARWRVTKSPA